MESRIIKSDFAPLNKFISGLGGNHIVKVGIFGNKTGRNEVEHEGGKSRMKKAKASQTNAELGALHEFGSFTKHIPPRSFLRMPLHQKSNDILAETKKGAEKLLASGDMVAILKRLGFACENAIQRAFASRGFGFWKENAPSTIRRKGSSAPLIDSEQLRKSIASKVE